MGGENVLSGEGGGDGVQRWSTAPVRWDGWAGTERRGAAQSFGSKHDVEEE